MIVVAGFNSSVDKWMEADELRIGGVSKVRGVRRFPGGKGLHVAAAIAALGEQVHLVGIVDRAHRDLFEDLLEERGVSFTAIPVEDELRTCVALRDAEGRITELLEPGPALGEASRELLCQSFLELAREASLCVLSGSLPCGFPDTTYRDLLAQTGVFHVRSLLDAGGELLRLGIQAQPFLVKPNRDEVSELLGAGIDGPVAAARAARLLGDGGIPFVVVSLGADGAVASIDARAVHAKPPRVAARNVVGSGDCLLAGLAVGLERGLDPLESLRLGVACGAAKAQNPDTGLLHKLDVDAILPRVEIEPVAS